MQQFVNFLKSRTEVLNCENTGAFKSLGDDKVGFEYSPPNNKWELVKLENTGNGNGYIFYKFRPYAGKSIYFYNSMKWGPQGGATHCDADLDPSLAVRFKFGYESKFSF